MMMHRQCGIKTTSIRAFEGTVRHKVTIYGRRDAASAAFVDFFVICILCIDVPDFRLSSAVIED
jgi:hypothetical protein